MVDLKEYGFENFEINEEMIKFIPARVTEVHRERYQVICQYGEVTARLKGTFYKERKEIGEVPVVGDFVYLYYNEHGDSLIVKLYERKSKFSRVNLSGHAAAYVKTVREQVVAANFDYVFILVSLNHDFNVNRIERYIGASLQSGGVPVVILTKADINCNYEKYIEQVHKVSNKTNVYAVSAKTGFGLSDLKQYFSAGKTVVFLGSSGVGKSSLVNAIAGEEIMKVNDIREDDSKGRHTTTHRQLIMLKTKTMIIDTPGMRELGMWNVEEGIKETFSDIEKLNHMCHFSNCSHKNEQGCAIWLALESGELSKDRWNSYLKLSKENNWGIKKSVYTKGEKSKNKMNSNRKRKIVEKSRRDVQ